jgi:hypothetical protein
MKLPALEKNIVIYRALEMSVFSFYAESFRQNLVETFHKKMNLNKSSPIKGGKLLKAIFCLLEQDGVITREESEEVQELLDYRNIIAHRIHQLTEDIQPPGDRMRRFAVPNRSSYDYTALQRLKKWENDLPTRLMSRYVIVISLDSWIYEPAERAIEIELKRLHSRITRQYKARKTKINEAKKAEQVGDGDAEEAV